LPIIVRALSGDRCGHEGTHYQISDVVIRPRPERPPTDFLWVGASSEQTARIAGQLGLGLMLPRGQAADAYKGTITAYRQAYEAAGFDPARARVAVTRCVLIGGTMAAARTSAEEALHRFYRQWSKSPENEPLPSFDDIIARLHVVVGDPETCRSQLTEFCRSVDLTHLTIQFSWGRLRQDDALTSIGLFGQHVLPHLRDYRPVGQA
jgi:alkanesulfonate monooxygenase SsuD/methylene tetrahydromethanopterin reductase-like flavin-dependent oxidoreductase (luciferase family)